LTGIISGQLPKNALEKMGKNPVLFIDSVESDISLIQKPGLFDISNIDIVKPKKAKKLIGDKGLDGAIYITTVKGAKEINWKFFKTKSNDYGSLIKSPQADSIVQYILNGHLLPDSAAPTTLFHVNDKNFISLVIFDKEKILSGNVKPKRYVVLITAKRSKGLVKISNTK
jgi:hypothetical protein